MNSWFLFYYPMSVFIYHGNVKQTLTSVYNVNGIYLLKFMSLQNLPQSKKNIYINLSFKLMGTI